MNCAILSVPIETGAGIRGCAKGPAELAAAGLAEALEARGHAVEDCGVVQPGRRRRPLTHENGAIKNLADVAAWMDAIAAAAYEASELGFPIFLGGDHSMSAGALAGMVRRAVEQKRRLFVLWLDAHPDFHTLATTTSGNLHGVPLAYASGQPGFAGYFPSLQATIDPRRICILGLRSIDPPEAARLARAGVAAYRMETARRLGITALVHDFLRRVRAEDGLLHVSIDADFLDPALAPAVGTPVAGGATREEVERIMDLLHTSGLVSSLDIAELNPTRDEHGRTARLLVAQAVRLVGRAIVLPAHQEAAQGMAQGAATSCRAS
jgi:arginase